MTHFIIELSNYNFKTKENLSIIKKNFPDFKNEYIEETSDFFLYLKDNSKDNFKICKKNQEKVIITNIFQHMEFVEKLNLSESEDIASIIDQSSTNLIIINEDTKSIKIKTDIFGLEYIYVVSTKKRIMLSSHLKYLLFAVPKLANNLNYDAMIEYLYGHMIMGEKTLFQNIFLLPPNSIIKIEDWMSNPDKSLQNALLGKRTYFKFPKNYDTPIDVNVQAKKTSEKIQTYISKLYSHFYKPIHFFLSGGLDSRVLVSSIPEIEKENTISLTFDTRKDGIEITKARTISKYLGIKNIFKLVGSKNIVKNYLQHMWLSEGLSNHVVSIIIDLLKFEETPNLFVDGYLGDTQFGGEFLSDIDEKFKKKGISVESFQKVVKKHEYVFPFKTFRKLINMEKNALKNIINNGIEKQLNLFPEVEDPILKLECVLAYTRGRLYTLGGTRVVSSFSNCVLPFYNKDIFFSYVIVPYEYRKKRSYQKLVLSNLNHNLYKFDSTSLKWYNRTKLAKYGLKIFRFIESFLGVPIIPQYSSVPYDNWMRTDQNYRKIIEDLIFNPNSLIWNILDKRNCQELFSKFFKRRVHLHKFLLHIIDLEIMLRIWALLRDKNLPITISSKTLNFEKKVEVNLNLDYILKSLDI